MYLYLSFLLLGIISGFFLLSKFPYLPSQDTRKKGIKVSVIVPARNEALNIGHLLKSLLVQTRLPDEIICIDDGSTDTTKAIIEKFPVTYLSVHDKPKGWTGKTWACQVGGEQGSGDLFIFVDADVHLAETAISNLIEAFISSQKIISIQPYHRVYKFFQHFALFFNLVGLAGNGSTNTLTKKKAGLFGPLILMPKTAFKQINGFYQVRKSVVEDVALGKVLEENKLEYQLFLGGNQVSFQMYHTVKELFWGFTKNYASGIAKTPIPLFMTTFLWVTSLTAIPIVLIKAIFQQDLKVFLITFILYGILTVHLTYSAKGIGTFKKIFMPIYPVFLLGFHFVLLISLYLKLFSKKVKWKDREISLKKD